MNTVITENDESNWDDDTGVLYHFPKRYEKFLTPGTEVVYYKGKIKNLAFREKRLTDEPHYFATAVIGKVYPDQESSKGDLFATISDFLEFSVPVLAKRDNQYFEEIPESQKTNYWRNGVRPISNQNFKKIVSQIPPEHRQAGVKKASNKASESLLNDTSNHLESVLEGRENRRFVTTYERNPKYRRQAIAIHGDSCMACGFNFGQFYGEYAEGYIHVHHVNPVSEYDSPKSIDPENDMICLCANCHSVVHRRKSSTLCLDELKEMIELAARALT